MSIITSCHFVLLLTWQQSTLSHCLKLIIGAVCIIILGKHTQRTCTEFYLQGLEQCHNLEELSLEHNCISKLEGIGRLSKLRHLSLSHNYIVSLEHSGLEHLANLHYLALDSNRVNSLAGMQRVQVLVEFYIGNNNVANVREIFYLKVSNSTDLVNFLKFFRQAILPIQF